MEAKSYSYDGDDWGDFDDYDEYGGYNEPVAPSKPTGFWQQGQSASPIASRGYGALERASSFDRGDERRAFSAGAPPYNNVPDARSQSNSHGHSSTLGLSGREERYITEQPQPQQPYLPGPISSNAQSRPSFDSQANTSAPSYSPPSNYRGVSYSDQPRPGYGSRAQSMTSNSSSVDFHSRRDFTPSAMPQPLSTRASPAPRTGNDFVAPPRKSSLSQQIPTPGEPPQTVNLIPIVDEESSIPSRERTENNSSKPLPFVRPADIYRRMQEERDRERQSQDSSRPAVDMIIGSQPALDNETIPIDTRERSDVSSANTPAAKGKTRPDMDQTEVGNLQTKTPLSSVAEGQIGYGMERLSDRPFLPDVTRISGFGESFLGSLEGIDQRSSTNFESKDTQQLTQPTVQAHTQKEDLEHQPSLGFRSLVHQAFEGPEDQIPPTPSSTNGSAVVRSDSEGTNAISPIISRACSNAHTNQKPEGRENNIPIITEEPMENHPRPTSSETVKTITRKASPITSPNPNSSESFSPSFVSGHHRNISTPSPDNSPARNRAKEVENIQVPQPQEAEIATASPITSYVADNVPTPSETLACKDAAKSQDSKSSSTEIHSNTDNTSHLSHVPTPGIAKPNVVQSHVLQSEPINRSESPITIDSSVYRADSPARNRVRDLAGRFGEVSPTRGGLEQSSRQNTLPTSISSQLEDPFAPRPPNDRMQSFRPNLPGGWDSFTSVAPASQVTGQPSTTAEEIRKDPVTTKQADERSDQPSMTNPPLTEVNEDIDINPTTVKRTLSKAPKGQAIDSPFSAVAVAGTALAGALVAAVGMSKEEFPPPEAEEFNAARGQSASLKGTEVHPDASKVWTNSFDDSVSSVAPTPSAQEIPPALDDSPTSDSEYFAPVVPLKQKPRKISTSDTDPVIPIRPPILPTLSTDPSPQDYESDRLRKEIVRELSPHSERFEDEYRQSPQPSQGDGGRLSTVPTSRSQGHDSIGLPREYESYWNATPDEEDMGNLVGEVPAKPSQTSASPLDEDRASSQRKIDDEASTTESASSYLQLRPELSHRFSWEPEPEEINTSSLPTNPNIVSEAQLQPQLSDLLQTLPSISPQSAHGSTAPKALPADPTNTPNMYDETVERNGNATQLSSSRPDVSDPSTQALDAVMAQQVPSGAPHLLPHDLETHQTNGMEELPSSGKLPPSSTLPEQQKIPPFREILALKTPEERINAFNATREQFAHMNTGLSNWITATINDLPEHSSLLSNHGQYATAITAHRPSPSRSKLASRLSSLQPLQQPYYQQYLNASSQPVPSSPTGSTTAAMANVSSSIHTPSAGSTGKSSKEQVRAKSKDLVHSAGIFGGKANSAAKGLFSKGRNKLRGSGGGDKVDS